MPSHKIPLYLMPGMAASPSIFDRIQLPATTFEVHKLAWFLPDKGMALSEYAQKMCTHIKHTNPVLLGVSFGGLLVQEMAKQIPTSKVIAVSCVKKRSELPKTLLFAKYTHLHKLLPTGLIYNVDFLAKYAFGEAITKRLALYKTYLAVRDKYYIDWCLDQLVHWNQTVPPKNLVHIHGDRDTVFPITNIKDCITVKNGTHAMILHRAKWFSEHLPAILLA